MLSKDTIEILKQLDKKELKRFGDFVKSPYHNSVSALEKIFEFVQKEHPHFSSVSKNYPKLFKKIYPKEEYQEKGKEKRMRNLGSEFSNLLKEFIATEERKPDNYDLNIFLAQGLRRKKLFDISHKVAENTKKQIEKLPLSAEKLLYHYRNYGNYFHYTQNRKKEYFSGVYENAEREISENLIAFSFRELFVTEFMFSHSNDISQEKKQNMMFDELLNSLDMKKFIRSMEKNGNKYVSYIKIYYLIHSYLINGMSEEEYLELKSEIFENIHKVCKMDQLHYIYWAIALIYTKLVPQNKKYVNDAFEFSKLFRSLKIYPDPDIDDFSGGPFRDMFTSAVILKEYEWAENFVNEYGQYIFEGARENEINYCRGVLFFKRKNYEKSLEYFNKVKLADIIEKINIRFYYMMNYIELKAYESALSALSTIRQFYYDRKDIPEIAAVLIEDSLKWFNEIILSLESGRKMDEMIYDEAIGPKRCYHKQYVIDKSNEINKK